MTATLKELLAEYAEQARPYEVREPALRRGRRLRRMRTAVPAGLVVVSLVATAVTLVWQPRQPADPQPASRTPVSRRPSSCGCRTVR
jgi:hypothetical protein